MANRKSSVVSLHPARDGAAVPDGFKGAISGTPLESHPAPSSAFMASVLEPLSRMVVAAGLLMVSVYAAVGVGARTNHAR